MKQGVGRLAFCAVTIALTLGCSAVRLSTVIPSEAPTSSVDALLTASPASTDTPTASDVLDEPSATAATVTEAPPAQPTNTTALDTPGPPASPMPSITSAPALEIEYFRASADEVDPGTTVRLEWATRHATETILYHLMPSGQYGSHWELDSVGSMDFEIPSTARNEERFLLLVLGSGGQRADAMVTIELRCPDEWFFANGPDDCPASPVNRGDGAEQSFQRGRMLWNGAERVVYVLYADGAYPKWGIFADRWKEGDAVSDPDIAPPAGLYQPIRGFGQVWRIDPSVRDRLGWAVNQETGYRTAIQRTSRFKYNVTFVAALDGGVWELGPEGSEWRHIPR